MKSVFTQRSTIRGMEQAFLLKEAVLLRHHDRNAFLGGALPYACLL